VGTPTGTMKAITNVVTATNLTTNNDKTGYTASTVSDKTGYSISGTKQTLDALNDISASGVNAEVVDALNVDTYTEPGQGAPGVTVTLVQKIGYLYKAWRNKTTQTATEYKLYNDDTTTVGQKSTVSDDATTFSKNEVDTGA